MTIPDAGGSLRCERQRERVDLQLRPPPDALYWRHSASWRLVFPVGIIHQCEESVFQEELYITSKSKAWKCFESLGFVCFLHQGFRTLLMGSESGAQICKKQCLVVAVWPQVYLETQGSKNITVTTTLTLKICDIRNTGEVQRAGTQDPTHRQKTAGGCLGMTHRTHHDSWILPLTPPWDLYC